jgi:hypothetical protein
VAGVLGGVLFVAWGYIDTPDLPENLGVVIRVLSFVVPALFLVAVLGLCILWRSRLGIFGWMGMVLAAYAVVWIVVKGIVGDETAWAYFALGVVPPYNLVEWSLMYTGLALVGIAMVRNGPSRGMGAWVLATGLSGWVYYLTDSGAVLEARLVHIGFGLLFSLGWVALGVGLFAAGKTSRKTKRSQEPG